MGSFSGLGIGLSFVFGFILMGLVGEVYYLLWWKKRKLYSNPTTAKKMDLEKPSIFQWCWKNPDSVDGVSRREVTNGAEQEDVEVGPTKFASGEEGIESELMRLHNLCGPPRFLFTIKEESREDLESEDGRSRASNCRSLIDGYDAVLPSPSFKNGSSWSGEAMTEAELNRLRSSPPPAFKFLRDAEEKFLEAERRRRVKNQESAIVREAQVVPLPSSPDFQTRN